MKCIIKKALDLNLWQELDIQFANMLVTSMHLPNNLNNIYKQKTALTLAGACLSAAVRSGHTCLPLRNLSYKNLFQKHYPILANEIIQKIGKLSINDWQTLLISSPAVGDGSQISPLVLDNKNLYLHRMWQDECAIAQFFNESNNHLNNISKLKIINILNNIFHNTTTEINWHKIATAIAMTHSRTLISGGAGTGKTSTIAKIISALLLYDNNMHIRLVTPTGKSATVLTNSCYNICNKLKQLHKPYTYQLPEKATTLHNLIKSQTYIKNNQYHQNTIMSLDYLIIDEASMISLSILAQLISILPKQTKVIFVGDHHQLYSIEPGSIFKDICQFKKFHYSHQRKQELTDLTGYILPSNNKNIDIKQYYWNTITDGTCILNKNYRFDKTSGIGQLANAVKKGNYNHALSILTSNIYTDIQYIHIKEKKDYINMLLNCASKYYNYLYKIQYTKKLTENIFKIFNNDRILCALRNGPFGIIKLNHYIEQILHNKGLITLNTSRHYVGKPIIVLKNTPLLGLYNGDIGILFPNSQNNLSAYFLLSYNKIKIVPIYQLPPYETCFAITVHKSQGSEFQNISIILPNQHIPILTRELLYTAITRAHQHITLYTTNNVLIQSINAFTLRYSGLYNRIKKYNDIH